MLINFLAQCRILSNSSKKIKFLKLDIDTIIINKYYYFFLFKLYRITSIWFMHVQICVCIYIFFFSSFTPLIMFVGKYLFKYKIYIYFSLLVWRILAKSINVLNHLFYFPITSYTEWFNHKLLNSYVLVISSSL